MKEMVVDAANLVIAVNQPKLVHWEPKITWLTLVTIMNN